MKNWIGCFIHNCVAHPLLPFLPKAWGNKFHDWTIDKFWAQAKWINPNKDAESSS